MAEVEQAIKRIPGLEQAGNQLANSIHSAVLQGGSLTRAIADALHGTWFGHPLHPALTDIPIGAWVLAAGFDAYAGLGGGPQAAHTADTLIAVGVAAQCRLRWLAWPITRRSIRMQLPLVRRTRC